MKQDSENLKKHVLIIFVVGVGASENVSKFGEPQVHVC